MMTWTDFINKIRTFREAGPVGLNAPALIRLLYAGAFDDMLSPEMRQIPALTRYKQLTTEMLHALGSKAQLPKKGAKELVGLNNLASPGHLMLWRYNANPFIQYDLTEYCVTFLKSLGYTRPKMQEGDISWVRNPPKGETGARTDVRYSWHSMFSRPSVMRMYENGDRLLAVVGIVVKAEKKIYQGSKESLAVTLFNGHEYTHEMRMWPGEDGKLNKGIVAQLEVGTTGLAIVRPKVWNERPTATMIHWTPVMGTA